jgi:hypothetical protein
MAHEARLSTLTREKLNRIRCERYPSRSAEINRRRREQRRGHAAEINLKKRECRPEALPRHFARRHEQMRVMMPRVAPGARCVHPEIDRAPVPLRELPRERAGELGALRLLELGRQRHQHLPRQPRVAPRPVLRRVPERRRWPIMRCGMRERSRRAEAMEVSSGNVFADLEFLEDERHGEMPICNLEGDYRSFWRIHWRTV